MRQASGLWSCCQDTKGCARLVIGEWLILWSKCQNAGMISRYSCRSPAPVVPDSRSPEMRWSQVQWQPMSMAAWSMASQVDANGTVGRTAEWSQQVHRDDWFRWSVHVDSRPAPFHFSSSRVSPPCPSIRLPLSGFGIISFPLPGSSPDSPRLSPVSWHAALSGLLLESCFFRPSTGSNVLLTAQLSCGRRSMFSLKDLLSELAVLLATDTLKLSVFLSPGKRPCELAAISTKITFVRVPAGREAYQLHMKTANSSRLKKQVCSKTGHHTGTNRFCGEVSTKGDAGAWPKPRWKISVFLCFCRDFLDLEWIMPRASQSRIPIKTKLPKLGAWEKSGKLSQGCEPLTNAHKNKIQWKSGVDLRPRPNPAGNHWRCWVGGGVLYPGLCGLSVRGGERRKENLKKGACDKKESAGTWYASGATVSTPYRTVSDLCRLIWSACAGGNAPWTCHLIRFGSKKIKRALSAKQYQIQDIFDLYLPTRRLFIAIIGVHSETYRAGYLLSKVLYLIRDCCVVLGSELLGTTSKTRSFDENSLISVAVITSDSDTEISYSFRQPWFDSRIELLSDFLDILTFVNRSSFLFFRVHSNVVTGCTGPTCVYVPGRLGFTGFTSWGIFTIQRALGL